MTERACLKCGSTTNGFHKNSRYKDGLHPYCKVCRAKANKSRRENETPEQRAERLSKAKIYREQEHRKERQRGLSEKWRRENPDRLRELGRSADRRRYLQKADYNKVWRAKNREVVASHSRNRRALVKNSEGIHTADDVNWLLRTQRYQCAVCRSDIKRSYHVDHILPLARGGSNDKTNLQVLCPTCNNQKHAADPIDFMQRKGFLL